MRKNITKNSAFLGLLAAGLIFNAPGMAATLATSDSRDTLVTQENLDNLSVGFIFENMKRNLEYDGGSKTKLEAYNYCGYLGYDLFQKATFFVTLGATEGKLTGNDKMGQDKFKWSGGINLKLWHYDLEEPGFMAGRCSIRGMAEYSQYETRLRPNDGKLKWNDLYAMLALNYEIFTTKIEDTNNYPYSLLIYAGPAVSKINAEHNESGQSRDLTQEHWFGIAGGVDIFASHNLSIGGQIQYFDNVTLSGSIIYNF